MKQLNIKYHTQNVQRKIAGKVFVLEVVRNLDEAIDQICELMTEEEKLDPFAEDLCPYFGVLWPAAEALSLYLENKPELVRGKRVLELGCGLGLPSLVASHLGGKVLATDFHPDVEQFFRRNSRHSSVTCDYQRLNWREEGSGLEGFDVVMGSDVLYESKHPDEIVRGLLHFVKPGGVILLSDPGRSYMKPFLRAMRDRGHQERQATFVIEGKENFVFEILV